MNKIVNPQVKELLLKAFGRIIQIKRMEKGLTQKEYALRCNSYLKKIKRIEEGQYDFKFSTLIALGKGLDMQVSELLDFKIPKELIKHFWMDSEKKDI